MFNSKLMYVLFYLYVYVYYSFFGEGVGMLSPNQCMVMIDVHICQCIYFGLHSICLEGSLASVGSMQWFFKVLQNR